MKINNERTGNAHEDILKSIKRRDFLTRMATVAVVAPFAGCGIESQRDSNTKVGGTSLDQYGGWTGKQFNATGFFRAEHDGNRWWLITPEGNAFISFGINHHHPNWWAQEYNREYWIKAYGAKEALDETWQQGFREAAISNCQRLGFNSLGFHSEAPILIDLPNKPILPYLRHYEPVMFSFWRQPKPEKYTDIFAPEFEEHCDRLAKTEIEPYKDDPMIIGYTMADIPIMSDNETKWSGLTSWPRVLRNLGPGSPGKQAYVSFLQERYQGLEEFNSAYKTDFNTWDHLSDSVNWRPETDFENQVELKDNMEFLRRCVDQYYKVAEAAIRRYDTNHMFVGDKLNGNNGSLENLVDITSKYTDLVLVQCYGRWEYQKPRMDLWVSKTDKPFINGDSSYGTPYDMMPNPLGNPSVQAKDHAECAEWTVEFAESAISRPEFVGWHICGIIDTWKTMPGKDKWQHCGLMTPTGEFYLEMESAIQDLSQRLYQIAMGNEK